MVALPDARGSRQPGGVRTAGAPRPQSAPQAAAPRQTPEGYDALTVLLANGDDVEQVRQAIRGSGGRATEFRVLDQRERREAFAPHRAQAGLRGEVTRGWEATVQIPRHAVPGLVNSLQRSPGRVVLERRGAPPAPRGRPAEWQSLRITILR